MSIIAINSKSSSITGGQVYDSFLFNTIQNLLSSEIEYVEPNYYPSGININKLLTPILELRLFKKIKEKDVCFMSSSMAYRHILLLLLIKFFCPKIKVFVTHHHFQYEVLSGLKKIFFKFFELNFIRLSTSIIIPSPYVLQRTKILMSNKRINYIEISFKENNDFAAINSINRSELLYIGTIEHRKGLHLLLDALFLLKKEKQYFKINLVGGIVDNEYYNKLLKKVTLYKLEKQVIFHGRVSTEILKNFLRTSDVFVFPSLLEGYGMVLMEAMSYGIPVIAFNNSAMPYTVKDGYNGFLAKNECIEDLKNLIIKVISHPELRKKLSEGARKTYCKSRREADFISDVKKLILSF